MVNPTIERRENDGRRKYDGVIISPAWAAIGITILISIVSGIFWLVVYYADSAEARFATKESVKSVEIVVERNRQDLKEIAANTEWIKNFLLERK